MGEAVGGRRQSRSWWFAFEKQCSDRHGRSGVVAESKGCGRAEGAR